MKGQVSHESLIDVPAGVVWETYGSLEVSKLIAKLLPNLVHNIQVLEGDGGVGTILAVTLPPGAGFSGCKEKITKVDNEKHVKEVEMVEGGFLNMGFLQYRIRLEILGRDGDSSIIKSTVEYEIAEESAASALLSLLIGSRSLLKLLESTLLRSIKPRSTLEEIQLIFRDFGEKRISLSSVVIEIISPYH